MSKTIPFTVKKLATVTCPPDKDRIYVRDAKTVGLTLAVSRTGDRRFVFYRKMNGRPGRLTIGRFPTISIEVARDCADRYNGMIAEGKNPFEMRAVARAELTFGQLFDSFMETHAKVHTKDKGEEYQSMHDRFLKPWRSRLATKIRKTDVRALHATVGQENGHYAANRLLSLVRGAYNKMDAIGAEGKNPATGIQRFKEIERERFLQPDEEPAFFKALNNCPSEIIRDYILLSMHIGARRSNIQAMRWEHVNLERGTWLIVDNKSGKPVTIPLVTEAIEILERRKAAALPDAVWVFPTWSKTGHLTDPNASWKKILDEANIKDFRLHDLRRTLGSRMAAAGVSLPIIGKALGHTSTSATRIYARLNLDPVRAAMQLATTRTLPVVAVPTESTTSGEK